MTIESAKAFYQRMTEDASFSKPFEADMTYEERQKLIRDSGYDFTAEEWNKAIAEIQVASSSEELNEKELEVIAGGGIFNEFKIPIMPMYGGPWLFDRLSK